MSARTLCTGSNQTVFGPDEPLLGTVYCSVCGINTLPMKTTTLEGGGQECSVPEHYASAPAPRPKRSPKRPSHPSDKSRGDGRNRGRP